MVNTPVEICGKQGPDQKPGIPWIGCRARSFQGRIFTTEDTEGTGKSCGSRAGDGANFIGDGWLRDGMVAAEFDYCRNLSPHLGERLRAPNLISTKHL